MAKEFVIGKVKRGGVKFMNYKDAVKYFKDDTRWEVISILLPKNYPSGSLTLRRADGGLKDNDGQEIYVRKSITADVLKDILKEYGFKKGKDVNKYLLVIVEDGSLKIECNDDRVGFYQWQDWGWKYVRTREDDEDEIFL